MRACRLNDKGLQFMQEWLESAAHEGREVPGELRNPGEYVEAIEPQIEFKAVRFANRLEFAAWVEEMILSTTDASLARDSGFWAWLTLILFEEVCPKAADGSRKIGAIPRYIPSFDEWKRYYRHLLAGPWMIYRAHIEKPQAALALLGGPLAKPGDVVEQFAARMEWVTNASVMEVVTALYFDRRKGTLKKGAGGKGRGSARRLAAILWQFHRTFDLYSVPPSKLLAMMPEEFGKFRN